MAHFEVTNHAVEWILMGLKNREIAIPEIQRPFVWSNANVRDLIDSMYRGYPCGYIITWKNDDVRLRDGSKSNGMSILIDGQQRVTALHAALLGSMVLDKKYKKKRIKIAFNPTTEEFKVSDKSDVNNPLYISDISCIFLNEFSSHSFVTNYSNVNKVDEDEVGKKIDKLRGLLSVRFGVIELSKNLDIEDVAEIFNRINSTGVSLSQADFIMSKIASNDEFSGNDTRKIIDYFCHAIESPSTLKDVLTNDDEFAKSEYAQKIKWATKLNGNIYEPNYEDVLRVVFTTEFKRGKLKNLVSLLNGRDFETKSNKIEIAEASYRTLLNGVMDFVNETNFNRYVLILKSAGFVTGKLIAKSKSTINFGYALYLTLRKNKINTNIIEKVVRKWVVLSILTGRYTSSFETTLDSDIKKFNEKDPEEVLNSTERLVLSDEFFNVGILENLKSSSINTTFNIFIAAQVEGKNRGFLSHKIKVEDLVEHGDRHHIFPKNYLVKNNYSKPIQYNQVANYVYTQTEINIHMRDDAPCVCLKRVIEQCNGGELAHGSIRDREDLLKNLDENAVPRDIINMDINDYDSFLVERRKLMAEKIREYYNSL